MKLGPITLGLVLWLSATAAWPQVTPTSSEMSQPPPRFQETEFARQRGLSPSQTVTPVPDPTVLTTQQLNREIASITEQFKIRLDAMDKAIVLLQDLANRAPTVAVVNQMLTDLEKLVDEKFAGRDKALSAALDAQKLSVTDQNKANSEAALKTENFFNKEIDGLKQRIDEVRSQQQEAAGQREGATWIWGLLGGLITGLIGIFGILIPFIMSMMKKTVVPPVEIRYVENGTTTHKRGQT